MGQGLARLNPRLLPGRSRREHGARVAMFGRYNVGQRTILGGLSLGGITHFVVTPGFTVMEAHGRGLTVRSTSTHMLDFPKMQPLWRLAIIEYGPPQGVIWVVDASPSDWDSRLEEEWDRASETLSGGVPVLVLANKQDVPGCASPGEVAERLCLERRLRGRPWKVQGCVATQGVGLEEGLARLTWQMAAAAGEVLGRR